MTSVPLSGDSRVGEDLGDDDPSGVRHPPDPDRDPDPEQRPEPDPDSGPAQPEPLIPPRQKRSAVRFSGRQGCRVAVSYLLLMVGRLSGVLR